MPITRVGVLGTAQSKTSGTSLAINGSLACAVDDCILIGFASDVGGTSYSASATGVTTASSVTEGSVASTNTRALVLRLRVTVAGTLTAITVSWTTAVTAKAGVVAVYRGVKQEQVLNRGWFNSSDSVATPYYVGGSSDRKLVTAGCLFFGCLAREEANPSTCTSPDTTWWVELTEVGHNGTTGNPTASNMTCLVDDMVPVVSYDGANTHDVTRTAGSAASSATAAVLYEPNVPFAQVDYSGRPDLSVFRRAMIVVPRDTSVPAGPSALIAQALTATATTTAAFTNQVGKIVTATATSTASIVKSVGKLLSATVTSTASILSPKIAVAALTATATTTASMVRSVGKLVTATSTTTATMVRSVGKLLSATATTTASIVKSVGKSLVGLVSLAPPGGAAAVTNLTAGNTSASGAAGTSASFSVAAGTVVFLGVHAYASSGSAPPGTPTITDSFGIGLTWTLVQALDIDSTGTDRSSIYVFQSLIPSNASGTVTITFSGTPPIGRMAWVIDQLSGTDTGGTNGSNAVVQIGTIATGTTETSLTATLAPFASSSNLSYGFWANETTTAVTYGSIGGFNVVGSANGVGGGFSVGTGTLVHAAGDFDAQGSWSGGTPYFHSGGVGMELSSPSSGAGGAIILTLASVFGALVPNFKAVPIMLRRGLGPLIPTAVPLPDLGTVPQIFNQALTATVTTTAAFVNQVGKFLTATATSTASIIKSVGKFLTATVTTTASILSPKTAVSALTTTVTTTATIVKQVGKPLSATATTTATMVKSVGKLLSATATSTAMMVKSVGTIIVGNATVSAFLDYTWSTIGPVMQAIPIMLKRGISPFGPQQQFPIGQVFAQVLSATSTTTAAIQNQVGKVVTATATSTATITKSVGKLITATAAVTSAAMTRSVGKLLSATSTTTAAFTNQIGKVLSATSVVTGFLDYTWSTIAPVMRAVPILLRRGIGPLIPQQLAPPFSPAASIQQALTATVTTTATIANSVGKALVATATTTTSMVRSVGKTLTATATSTASILAQKTKLVALTATATTTALIQNSAGKLLAATATTTGSITKRVGKLLSASSVTTATMGVVKQIGGLIGLVFKMFDRSTPSGTMTESSPESPVFDDTQTSGETFSSSPASSSFDPPSSED